MTRRNPVWMARRLLVVLLLGLLVSAPALADDPYARKRAVDARLDRLYSAIAQAEKRESALSEQISLVTGEIRALEGRVGDVSRRLTVLQRDLALHRERLAHLTALFRLQTNRLRFLRGEYATALARLNRRLVEIYESEPPTTISVVLSASSFTDLLEQLDYMREIGSQDRRIADAVGSAKLRLVAARGRTQRTRGRVASATRAIRVRVEQERAARSRLLASQRGFESARLQKRQSLVAVRESEHDHRNEAEALLQVSAQLAAQIRSAQAVAAPVSSGDATGNGAVSASGLAWPVSGPVISPFGLRGGRMHEGIDVSAPAGTPVAAAAAGTVIFSGVMSGYGNLVVIDHGGGLATAYAHHSSNAVSSGQQVAQGQTVGYVGCTGHCYGEHLHFEVRVNGAAVDPLGYL